MSPAQLANLRPGYRKPPKINKSVTFDLHPDEIAEIDRVASNKGISRGAEIRRRLDYYNESIAKNPTGLFALWLLSR
jgi:hypothetical protein